MISEITKQDILDLFQNGLTINDFFDTKTIKYCYCGRLNEIEFLKRIYKLGNMPSFDSRFQNAEEDIWQHTVNNDDYPENWVFSDERFGLKNGTDETYLRFIVEIFHPVVRDEKGFWKEYLEEINRLLMNDGYILCPMQKMSNRDIYGWKVYQKEEDILFIPFSQRHLKEIKEKKIKFSISKRARNQIYQFLEKYNIQYQATTETGWNYNTEISEDVFKDIRRFYVPKCYNEKNEYVETNSLYDFVCATTPFHVLDVLELFYRHSGSEDFEVELNAIFKINDISLKMENGKIERLIDIQIQQTSLMNVQEVGLKELMQETLKYYDEGNVEIAVEKLWDAFERLKTYYCSSAVDKKLSVNKLVGDMSNNQKPFADMFDREFLELTSIGNSFRIRHHEKTKTDILDERHYQYFYKRCLSLVLTAIQYLEGGIYI